MHGFTLYWGDAEAHLNNARRMVEARHTGYEQIGRIWLPFTQVLMLPWVVSDRLWRSGLAGAISSALCFTAAASLLFAATRRVLGPASAWCATALFLLNPNALYLQSIPMMEAVFFMGQIGILFFTIRYRETQSITDLTGAAILCLAASLTRYEGWIFIPFVTLYVFWASRTAKLPKTLFFGALASAGILWWLYYNWWLTGDMLDFYRGPGSPKDIQGGHPYPGHGDWRVALEYYLTASKLVVGWPLLWLGAVGIFAAIWRGAKWPIAFLALWPAFIVLSMHSSAQPIFVPTLEPHSWYNTRYALAMLPLLAFGAGALAQRANATAAVAIMLAGGGFWLFHCNHEDWICWKESERNSIGRRAWTHGAAAYLETQAKTTDTFFATFGDITGIFREAGIRFERTLTWDDSPDWQAAVNRPDLFLWEDWAVALRGDPVDKAIQRANLLGVHYDLATEIIVPDATPIEIYRRHEYSFR